MVDGEHLQFDNRISIQQTVSIPKEFEFKQNDSSRGKDIIRGITMKMDESEFYVLATRLQKDKKMVVNRLFNHRVLLPHTSQKNRMNNRFVLRQLLKISEEASLQMINGSSYKNYFKEIKVNPSLHLYLSLFKKHIV